MRMENSKGAGNQVGDDALVGVVGPDDGPIPVEGDAVSRERGALVELDGSAGLDRVGEERGDAEVLWGRRERRWRRRHARCSF